VSHQSNAPLAIELPVLRLGIAGFDEAEQACLATALAARSGRRRVPWKLVPLGQADAWCVNGSRVQRLPDGSLRITPGLPSGRAMRVDPADVDWPIAFSTPAGPPGFNPTYVFDIDAPDSIQAVLDQLEGWLRPLMVQFALASTVVHGQLDLHSGVYHVSVNGKLYAMVNRRHVGVWALADPAALPHAVWSRRPDAADAIPAFFVRTGFPEFIWQYAIRTSRDCLPPHYRTSRLFLRRPPRLPVRLLTDTCLLLVRELGVAPGTLAQLAERTGIQEGQMARHLAALHMVGAVTSNAKRAAAMHPGVDIEGWNLSCPVEGASVPGPSLPGGAELTVRLTSEQLPGCALS
jgi:hypothetical protein